MSSKHRGRLPTITEVMSDVDDQPDARSFLLAIFTAHFSYIYYRSLFRGDPILCSPMFTAMDQCNPIAFCSMRVKLFVLIAHAL